VTNSNVLTEQPRHYHLKHSQRRRQGRVYVITGRSWVSFLLLSRYSVTVVAQ